ncbi:unnamed protein product [Strongylus vulgaris]|uniref:Uncharacterized protein n=1 Tax=Strongylus vulgaris TaxID=40348 RepID=A0A3P7KAU5_STRVU|nr:unnamed protein product [Strongylus vulgaris]
MHADTVFGRRIGEMWVAAIEIKSNHYLEDLGLKKLIRTDTMKQLEISSNRILQISFDEAEVFAASNMNVDQVNGFYPTGTFPAIRLNFLPKLVDIELPMLRSLYAPTSYKFTVDGSPNLNVTLAGCSYFKDVTHAKVWIDFLDCNEWYDWKTQPTELVESF